MPDNNALRLSYVAVKLVTSIYHKYQVNVWPHEM